MSLRLLPEHPMLTQFRETNFSTAPTLKEAVLRCLDFGGGVLAELRAFTFPLRAGSNTDSLLEALTGKRHSWNK